MVEAVKSTYLQTGKLKKCLVPLWTLLRLESRGVAGLTHMTRKKPADKQN